MYQTITAGDEVRTEVAVSRTEDQLVVLCTLYAVFHHVAVHINIIVCVSIRSMVQPGTVQQYTGQLSLLSSVGL